VNSRTASTLVLITGGLLITYAALDAKNGTVTSDVTYKRIYSSFLATVALGVAADLAPAIVGPFAILIIVAAWAKHKGALGGLVGSATTGAAAAHSAGAAAPANTGNTIGGAK
jgi:hypothetical protein